MWVEIFGGDAFCQLWGFGCRFLLLNRQGIIADATPPS
jgi:hypothetical protein